jgi:hypothetical protein
MRPKMLKNTNNIFELQFLMHLNYVLGKISVALYSHQSVN